METISDKQTPRIPPLKLRKTFIKPLINNVQEIRLRRPLGRRVNVQEE